MHGHFLLVAYYDQASEVFRRLGQGESTEDVLTDVLGLDDLDQLHTRITRWLNDEADYEEGKSKRVSASRALPR